MKYGKRNKKAKTGLSDDDVAAMRKDLDEKVMQEKAERHARANPR